MARQLKGDTLLSKEKSLLAKEDRAPAKEENVLAKEENVLAKEDSVLVKRESEVIKESRMTDEQENEKKTQSASLIPDKAVPLVLREDHNGVACLMLNRPKAYNALSLSCMQALQAELKQIADEPDVRVVVLSGSGKGFCAGHDLKEMQLNASEAFYQQTFATCAELMQTIQSIPQPVIAKIRGIATAAGCQLVATCDLAYAANDARFATPGVNIGLFCSTPMVALSRAIHRKQALEMLLTGDMFDAAYAQSVGLINRAVDATELDSEVARIAQQIAEKSSYTLKVGKQAFYQQVDISQAEAYALCSQIMTENMLAYDAQEGIDAFLNKRPPCWSGR